MDKSFRRRASKSVPRKIVTPLVRAALAVGAIILPALTVSAARASVFTPLYW